MTKVELAEVVAIVTRETLQCLIPVLRHYKNLAETARQALEDKTDAHKHKHGDDGRFTGQGGSSSRAGTSPHEKVASAVKSAVAKGAEKFTSTKDTATRFASAGFDKLPQSAQTALSKTWGAAKWVEHKVMIGFHKTRELAVEAAKQRGMSDESAVRLGKVLATVDIISAWTVNMPATLAVTGSFTAAKISSWVPVASLSYLAYSTARNPMATARAAKAVIGGKHAKTQEAWLWEDIDANLTGVVADRLQAASEQQDWYVALLSAALDANGGNLQLAIDQADATFEEEPVNPSGDGKTQPPRTLRSLKTTSHCTRASCLKTSAENDHPRGPDGRFIKGAALKAAADDPAKAAELRGKLDDTNKAKLDAYLSKSKGEQAAHHAHAEKLGYYASEKGEQIEKPKSLKPASILPRGKISSSNASPS